MKDGSVREFDGNYSLLSPFICEAIGVKEERRYRNKLQQAEGARDTEEKRAIETNGNADMDVTPHNPVVEENPSTSISTDQGYKSIILKCHEGKEVYTCSWSPVAQQVISGSSDGTCRIWGLDAIPWDNSSSENVSVLMSVLPHYRQEGENYKDVTSIQWSPNGEVLATGCYDGIVRIWSSIGNLMAVLDKHDGPVFALKWSRDGKYVLSGGNDRKAVVWDPVAKNVIKSYFLHSSPILDVDWADGDMFATSSSDRYLYNILI